MSIWNNQCMFIKSNLFKLYNRQPNHLIIVQALLSQSIYPKYLMSDIYNANAILIKQVILIIVFLQVLILFSHFCARMNNTSCHSFFLFSLANINNLVEANSHTAIPQLMVEEYLRNIILFFSNLNKLIFLLLIFNFEQIILSCIYIILSFS